MNIFQNSRSTTIAIPQRLTSDTMRRFVHDSLSIAGKTKGDTAEFDFQNLRIISPVGIAVLSNTFEFLKHSKIAYELINHSKLSEAILYLDEAGIFKEYSGGRVFFNEPERFRFSPLARFHADQYSKYFFFNLLPWLKQELNISSDAVEAVSANLEEIFHNVDYHSGIKSGCVFAQHIPKKGVVEISVSDFGCGIPQNVSKKLPGLSDDQCIYQACQEGFTTQSNVRNRGVGLTNLIRFTTRHGGRVEIHSKFGFASTSGSSDEKALSVKTEKWAYPGTLVHVVLRTDTLEKLETDVKPQEFQWT